MLDLKKFFVVVWAWLCCNQAMALSVYGLTCEQMENPVVEIYLSGKRLIDNV